MSYVIQELCAEIGELKQALAEKDREIEAKETELGKLDAEVYGRHCRALQCREILDQLKRRAR